MKEIYDNYNEHALQMNSPTKEAFRTTAREYSAWFQKFLPTDKNAKILDVGCGMGHFLYFLQQEGYTNYWGIDISLSQVEFVRANITKRVTIADAFDYLGTNGVFQVIVANDVLEHIPKDKTLRFLKLTYDAIESNGLLLIKTINMANPFGLKSRYVTFTHEVGYTEYSLKEVLSASGFHEFQIVGAHYDVRTFKTWLGKLREGVAHAILNEMFKAQRYNPQGILDPDLIAICVKK